MREWRYSSTFLDLGTRWRRVVSFTPLLPYSWGKSPRCPLDRRLGGLQIRSRRCGNRKILQCPKSRVVSFTPLLPYPWGKSPRCPLDRRLGGPQIRSRRCGDRKILHCPKSKPGHSARSPSLYRLSYPNSYSAINDNFIRRLTISAALIHNKS
jgi:hypothetical protein